MQERDRAAKCLLVRVAGDKCRTFLVPVTDHERTLPLACYAQHPFCIVADSQSPRLIACVTHHKAHQFDWITCWNANIKCPFKTIGCSGKSRTTKAVRDRICKLAAGWLWRCGQQLPCVEIANVQALSWRIQNRIVIPWSQLTLAAIA